MDLHCPILCITIGQPISPNYPTGSHLLVLGRSLPGLTWKLRSTLLFHQYLASVLLFPKKIQILLSKSCDKNIPLKYGADLGNTLISITQVGLCPWPIMIPSLLLNVTQPFAYGMKVASCFSKIYFWVTPSRHSRLYMRTLRYLRQIFSGTCRPAVLPGNTTHSHTHQLMIWWIEC